MPLNIFQDSTLQRLELMAAAQAMGMVSAPMGGFDTEAGCAESGIGAVEWPVTLVAIGLPASGNWSRKTRHLTEDILAII